jgi:hypothetical protein
VAHHRLVHGYNIIQHRHGPALDSGDEGAAGPDSLFFLFRVQKLRDPSGGLLLESQILVKDAVNGINRHPMDGSKRFDALVTICFNGGGNRSYEAGSPDRFLWIEMSLVVRVFSSLNFFQNGINSRLVFFRALYP